MKFLDTRTGQPPYHIEQNIPVDERMFWAPVVTTQPPWYDATTHRLDEGLPALEAGEWIQTWRLVPLSNEELRESADAADAELQAWAQAELDDTDKWFAADRAGRMAHEKFLVRSDYRAQLREIRRGNSKDRPARPK